MVRLNRKIAIISSGQDDPETRRIREQLRETFPDRLIAWFASLDDALEATPATIAMVVLAGASIETVERAHEATDDEALPRWAVYTWTADHTGPPDAAQDRGLSQALEQHHWRKRAIRAEGDARTTATRICHDLRSPMSCLEATFYAIHELSGSSFDDASVLAPGRESIRDLARVTDRLGLVCWASTNESKLSVLDTPSIVDLAQVRAQGHNQNAFGSLSLPATWPDVVGVPTWAEFVWIALLENAVRHAGDRPTVAVSWEERPENRFRFFVRDDGPNPPEKDRTDLFVPFHLLHSRRDVRGFGLSIVLRLVSLMGGTCGYAENAAGGANFWFELPGAKR